MSERQLTILQMLPALQGGGVERGTLEVAKALIDRGHRSLVMSAGGRMVEQLMSEGSQHIQWPVDKKSLWTLSLVRPLRKLLLKESVDVLHYRSRVPGWVAYLAWRGMPAHQRPKLVSTVHGLHSVSPYSAVMTRGEKVIAVSETVKQYIVQNYLKTPLQNIVVIPRGVDPQAFPYGYAPEEAWLKSWREQYPQLQGKMVIALPGRLTRLKGHHDFIHIVETLRRGGIDIAGLVIGGEDPRRREYAQELYRSVEEKGLTGRVIFTGHRNDMREIYSQCDAVLSLSSKPESFGRTVLEALSLGRPVMGYDHGGVGEILSALYPDGAVPLGDWREVADRIARLVSGEVAVVQKNERYLLPEMLNSTLALYQSLADG